MQISARIDNVAAELTVVKTAGNKASSRAESDINSVKSMVTKLEKKLNDTTQQQQTEPVGLAGLSGFGEDGELAVEGELAEETPPQPHITTTQSLTPIQCAQATHTNT